MTLVCALKCNNGIVIGSDGQASVNTSGGAIRHNIQKIYKIGKHTVFFASGTIGLIQKCLQIVNMHAEELDKGFTLGTLESIRKSMFPVVKNARDSYVQYNNKTEGSPMVDMVLCGFDKSKEPRMWHMSADTHDEFIDAVGCYCSGNGETFGYSLLKSFGQSSSNVTSGKLIVYRVLRDTINSLAFGVGGPIDMWVVFDNRTHRFSKEVVHRISNIEMENLSDLYKRWKEQEAKLLSETHFDIPN
jgi:20S proteasome alpha/beta subunit